MHSFPERFRKLPGRAVRVNTNVTIFPTRALPCQPPCIMFETDTRMGESGGEARGIEGALSSSLKQLQSAVTQTGKHKWHIKSAPGIRVNVEIKKIDVVFLKEHSLMWRSILFQPCLLICIPLNSRSAATNFDLRHYAWCCKHSCKRLTAWTIWQKH